MNKPNNTRITCPVCGQTDYYRLKDQNKTCACCGGPLDRIPDAPRFADKGTPRFGRTFPEPEPAAREPRKTIPEAPPIRRPSTPEVARPDAIGSRLKWALTQAKNARDNVTIYTTNGYQLHGCITGFDDDCVILDSDGNTPIVMLRAISTILPGNVLKTGAAEEK